jgi:hypothetical protein
MKQTLQLNSPCKIIQNVYTYYEIFKISKTGWSNHQTNITVKFGVKNGYESFNFFKGSFFDHAFMVFSPP